MTHIALLNRLCGFAPTKTWRQIDLNEYAFADFHAHKGTNPLLDPEVCAKWVADLAPSKSVDYTYGGYMEDRSFLWRGSYLDPKESVHLGVDVNVPAGTLIHCPVVFRVVEAFSDPDQKGGWGGRVIVETRGGALVVFAHLDLRSFRLHPHVWYRSGVRLGTVAPSSRNGGWYPHLHLQGLECIKLLHDHLDGYGPRYARTPTFYPEPLAMLTPSPIEA